MGIGFNSPVVAATINLDRLDTNNDTLNAVVSHGTKGPPTAVTVGSGPGGTLLLAANANRKEGRMWNNEPGGGKTMFIGRDASVTILTGYPVLPQTPYVDDWSTDAWFGITSAGTLDARVIEKA